MSIHPTVNLLMAAARLCVRPWLAVALCGGMVSATTLAAEAQSERAARLGFRFDQQAHDAAVAAREKGGTLDLDPADPDVVRLPKYEVQERRIGLSENEMLTSEGRVALAKKRHLTPVYQKIFGPLAAVASLLNNPLGGWKPNAPEAMAIYEDNLALERRKEMADLAGLAAYADRVNQQKERTAKSREDKKSEKR
ncbi:hypothetical protein [Opitutus terrae]|uniref:Uncharacterized protein n=1 Tax=Opitutus terrae (strain DSM 11246 / JCM 15787 / PB90-1) TaxID=452637 RepID=B1ZZK6_OPITP|nr:hypothetical protein [Opitutus terrae]ACB76409.1 hypothetical protein Oter_3129 [Opitutus terrae PB90-1]